MVHSTTTLRFLTALLPFFLAVTSLPTHECSTSIAARGPHDSSVPTSVPALNKKHGFEVEFEDEFEIIPAEEPTEGKHKHHSKLPAASSTASPLQNAKAVYFMTNDEKNAIVAMRVGQDGTLSNGSMTLTGGKGGIGVTKGQPAAVDTLFSQSAIRVGAGMIMAVNAGSNTLSLFMIDAADPTKLIMAGKPVDTMGDFPVSVGFSDKLMQACVANSGARAGVACFSASSKGLVPLQSSQRPLNIKQTTPPVGPEGTISHALFNSDSSLLLVTVKGNPAVNNTGFIAAYPVQNGQVSTQVSMSSPNGTAVLFGTANVNATTVLATDASFGAAMLSVTPGGDPNKPTFETIASTPVKDQKATCWAALSPQTNTMFVTDVGVNHVVEIDPVSGALIRELNLDNGNPGMIDLAAAGGFVYALSPASTGGAMVLVLDVRGGKGTAKQVQNFKAGAGSNSMGMTFV